MKEVTLVPLIHCFTSVYYCEWKSKNLGKPEKKTSFHCHADFVQLRSSDCTHMSILHKNIHT